MYLNFLRRRAAVALKRQACTARTPADVPKDANVLLVSVQHELARTQTYPFYFYKRELRSRHGIRFAEMPLEGILDAIGKGVATGPPVKQVKRIFFQPFLHMDDMEQAKALRYLKDNFPNARIALMDWFAPLHVRPSVTSAPFIDLYIKKQTFRDFSQYERPTIGDTNLNDYYARRHDIADAPMQFSAPPGLAEKIRLGSNFGLSPQMVDLFLGPPPTMSGRDIDLHARIAANGTPWYQAMRQEAKRAVAGMNDIRVASEGRVKRVKFFAEMKRSKICFSPFGYGEVCWRDYEAFATGALLLKPDMGHLTVAPDVFIPDETYVSLRWDLADFPEKVHAWLGNHAARERIALQAFYKMRSSITSLECVDEIGAWCNA